MTRDDETKAETEIRRTIRLSCEGLGLPPGEAEDIAGRAIENLRARKKRVHGAGAVRPVAVAASRPALSKPEPSTVRKDDVLIDHMLARRRII
ncbi:hypothetical protein E2977_00950 (plasmid) [Paracoccus yeei]|nr:hypothetical protein [Paracoccus yeei]MBY0135073.1 hypothetical protein [Paracoccus yeei]